MYICMYVRNAYLMCYGSIHGNKFATTLYRMKEIGVIFTTKNDFTCIRITIHYPLDQVLNVFCDFINFMENNH